VSDVLVCDLAEAVVEQLKARARGSGRSLQAELKLILEQPARPGPARSSRADHRVLPDRVRAAFGGPVPGR